MHFRKTLFLGSVWQWRPHRPLAVHVVPMLLASILLSGCEYDLISETPVIPETELVDPALLAGDYWVVKDAGGDWEISSSRWQAGANRTAARGRAGADAEDQAHFRLVELTGGDGQLGIKDVLLEIRDDPETGMSGYGLIIRMESGLADLRQLQIIETAPWIVQDRAYRSQVAAHHGLTIDMDADDADGALIDGPIDGQGIVGLLRDPRFLATLSAEFEAAYLPMGVDAEIAGSDALIDRADEPRRSIWFNGVADMDTAVLANPPALGGVFDVEGSKESYGLPPVVEFQRLEKGSFRLDDIGFEVSLLALPQETLEEDGEPLEAYLALQQWKPSTEADSQTEADAQTDKDFDEDRNFHIWLIARDMDDDDCWDFGEIYEALRFDAKPLDEMRVKIMDEAAKRHSLSYGNGGVIKGDINPSNLVALFRDGQFTSALVMKTSFSLCPQEAD